MKSKRGGAEAPPPLVPSRRRRLEPLLALPVVAGARPRRAARLIVGRQRRLV
jgi:hypothetical protein